MKRHTFASAALVGLFFAAVACVGLAQQQQTPPPSAAAQTAAAQPAAPGMVVYNVDTSHSNVGFHVPILAGVSKVSGKFNDFAVTINYDEKDVTKSSVSATIKAASIDTGIERRDNHLRNADFFEVEKYPEITFQSSRIERRSGENFIAHGTLTMHGVSKEVALPFNSTGTFKNPQSGVIERGFTSKLTLNRKDFGISFSRPGAPDFIGDVIEIELNLLTRTPPKQG